MKPYKPDNIDSLPELFYALIGGKPEDLGEIKSFLAHNDLNKLLSANDIDNIIYYDGYFGDENTMAAVYALLPIEIPLKNEKKINLLPSTFRKMNIKAAQNSASRIINVDFGKVFHVYSLYYAPKMRIIIKNKEKFQHENQKVKNPEAAKQAYHRRQAAKTEEEKAVDREKNRLRMQKYRAEHPEKRKSYYKKLETLTPLEQIQQRSANRRRNKKYRDNNNEAIRVRHNQRRAKIKEENPELLKALDKKHNETENRKIAGQKYYQTHKEEINRKAKENPKVKEYKKRYKNKKRFQEKTGVPILSLLQGIINAKSK